MNSRLLVSIKGHNVMNYVKWLIKNKINLMNLQIINSHELRIIIAASDYQRLKKYSKTYSVNILKKYGHLRLLDFIKKNTIIFISLIIAIIFLYFISSYIFKVEIIYNDQEVVSILKRELAKYDIKPYQRKKNYNYLNYVKKQILNNNKDRFEWLEIEEKGTKYIVKLVERKKEIQSPSFEFQSIVAKKNAIIKTIIAYSGEKTTDVNQYVKKGDVIISGILTKPDGTNLYTKASGQILGEVWYKIAIEYPMYYQEEKLTGNNKTILAVVFLNKEIPILPYKKYKHFNKDTKILLDSWMMPLKLVKEKIYEVTINENIYTTDTASIKAISLAKDKLKMNNKNIAEINSVKILSKQLMGSKIKLNLFVSVIEDITEIKEEKPEE